MLWMWMAVAAVAAPTTRLGRVELPAAAQSQWMHTTELQPLRDGSCGRGDPVWLLWQGEDFVGPDGQEGRALQAWLERVRAGHLGAVAEGCTAAEGEPVALVVADASVPLVKLQGLAAMLRRMGWQRWALRVADVGDPEAEALPPLLLPGTPSQVSLGGWLEEQSGVTGWAPRPEVVRLRPRKPFPVRMMVSEPDPFRDWQHRFGLDHPLLGRIWSAADGRWVSEGELLLALGDASYVLLGEKHDNADHHLLQARIIESLQPSAVAFEMLDGRGELASTTLEQVRAETSWDRSGWPDFSLYAPVFAASLDAGASLLTAHPAKEELMAVMKGGPVSAALQVPERPYAADDAAALASTIERAHCGHASPAMTEMMVRGQQLKDRYMADGLVRGGPGTVLIAGAGHVRADFGVPQVLGEDPVKVLFAEPSDDVVDPSTYLRRDDGEPLFDYVWFTSVVDRDDPCETFREQLQQMGH